VENDPVFKRGVWGTSMTAICCFTPLLPWVLGFIGLTLLVPYLDYVLFPLLALFLVMIGVGWRRRQGTRPDGGTQCNTGER